VLIFASALAYLRVIDQIQDENDVSILYLGPLKSLLGQLRALGMVAANSTGHFRSDFGCNFAYRLYRPFALDSTRCMCMDTVFD